MTARARKDESRKRKKKPAKRESGLHAVRPHFGELVLGLVAPAGVDLDKIGEIIRGVLKRFDYSVELIKLSDSLRRLSGTTQAGNVIERYSALMNAGDEYRRSHGNAAVAKLAVPGIVERRKSLSEPIDGSYPPARAVYVIKSLKTPEEVEFLRSVYGPAFIQMSVGESESRRLERLLSRLRSELRRKPTAGEETKVEGILERDERDASRKYGQNVRETFPLADLFVDMNAGVEAARSDIDRFFKLVFGFQFASPTRDEWGMFVARASAVRSLELGRQVGAAVLSTDGQLLATGCNELPQAGGGLVWSEDLEGLDDPRDWKRGYDTNRALSIENVVEMLEALREAKFLSSDVSRNADEMVAQVEPYLRGIRALSLIEYGRAVHAEMSAVVDASRRGIAIQNSHLYTTTFPCHNCARHIIAAGIQRVIFIEPYPKSLASSFHNEAIDLGDGGSATGTRVKFEAFNGISPRVYMKVFEAGVRKDQNGKVQSWNPHEARPRDAFLAPHIAYFDRESFVQEEELP